MYRLNLLILLFIILLQAEASGDVRVSDIEAPGGRVKVELSADSSFVTLTPMPNTDYQFLQWVDNQSTDNPRTIRLDTFSTNTPDTIIRAAFVHIPSTIFPEGAVSVTVNDKLIPTYNLHVSPNDPIITPFSCWSNADTSLTTTYYESMGNVIPHFQGFCTQTISCPGGKIIYSTGHPYFQLAARPNKDYIFQQWADGNTNNPRQINISQVRNNDTAYRAVFVHQPSVHMRGGDVDVKVVNPIQPTFQLTAIPDLYSLSKLSHWSNGEASNPINYVESQGNVIPLFDGIVVDTISCYGGHIEFYVQNKVGYIKAVPNTDYAFQQWIEGNKTSLLTTNPITVDLSNSQSFRAKNYAAVFVHQPSVRFERGVVEVQLDDPKVPSFELSLLHSCDYNTLSYWTGGKRGKTISYRESDGNIIPHFKPLIIDRDFKKGGIIEIEDIECGYRLTAIPDSGYTFSHWDDNSTTIMREVSLEENEYVATFMESKYPFKVGENYFATASEAVQASGNKPIEVLLDVEQPIDVNKSVTVDGQSHQIGDLIIRTGNTLSLSGILNVRDFYIEARTGTSGQLFNKDFLKCEQAYLDYQLESNQSSVSSTKWYAFSVPFEVDVNSGVTHASGGTKPTNGQDYFIYEYDGNLRASTKENGWVRMYSGSLTPGHFYMMSVRGNQNIWRFVKKSGVAIGGDTEIPLYQFMSNYQNRGWNAVGNSLVTYANATIPDIIYVQIFDNGMGKYMVRPVDSISFVVASPFFVQVQDDSQMTLSDATHSQLYSPSRSANQEEKVCYEVKLSNATQFDRLYITARPSASINYEIGKDVIKLFNGNTQTYLWTNAYGYKLCAQDAILGNQTTDYDLTLSAPTTGEYTLSASGSTQYPLYLMYQGQQIWTLSESDYSLDLTQGNNTGYSLRIGSKQEIGTGVNQTNAPIQTTKMIHQGLLYIYREGHLYNAQGELVR